MKQQFKHVFRHIRPGVGHVFRENNRQVPKRKRHEKAIAQWLVAQVGGIITILDESHKKSIRMPDMLRDNSEIIEVKRVSSATSIDSAIKLGIVQLGEKTLSRTPIAQHKKMKKILILDGTGYAAISKIPPAKLRSIIRNRINRQTLYNNFFNIDHIIIKRHRLPVLTLSYSHHKKEPPRDRQTRGRR